MESNIKSLSNMDLDKDIELQDLYEINLETLYEKKKKALDLSLSEKLYSLSLYQQCGMLDENKSVNF